MDTRLLDILVCPLCKGNLQHDRQRNELVCKADRMAFPIRDGIPMMLESAARETGVDAPNVGTPGVGTPVETATSL